MLKTKICIYCKATFVPNKYEEYCQVCAKIKLKGGKKQQMENTEQQKNIDWRDDVSDSANVTLKVLDGESKTVKFLDEGNKKTSVDYGTSIVFKVEHGEEEMNFYVKENNFSLLKQIKELGSLIGIRANISRKGSKKSDTRYTIESLEPKVA